MCTVSWLHAAGGFELFSNRDERIGRAPERPPELDVEAGVQFLSPRDGEAGGTWVAVNEFGVALTLLNGYRSEAGSAANFVSRGALVTGLASAGSLDELAARVEAAELTRYRSFVLLVLAANQPAWIADWDGAELRVDRDGEARRPLVSSSFEAGRAVETRRARFEALRAERGAVDAELLAEFHRSHADGPGPFSVCMHRDDAATRSFTRVTVTAERVELSYQGSAPCAASAVSAGARLTLARR